jgi:hypothetical protein
VKQLPLLKFRKLTLRQIVIERLRDFSVRQRAREQRREQKRKGKPEASEYGQKGLFD